MIFGNCITKMKLVEQLTLVTLQAAHHGSTSPRIASTQRNHAARPVSTYFCNKIRQKRSSAPSTLLTDPSPTLALWHAGYEHAFTEALARGKEGRMVARRIVAVAADSEGRIELQPCL